MNLFGRRKMIMNREMWRLLGIEPTTQLSEIKSAYADQAKKYHPEEYPEEFQRLRKAYKSAVQYAKQAQSDTVQVEPELQVKLKPDVEEKVQAEIQTELQIKAEPEPTIQPQPECNQNHKEEKLNIQEMDFDYGEVREDSLEDLFLKELSYIAMNPYLINNTLAWKVFLERDNFRKLLKDHTVRSKMIEKLSKISGWQRKTIKYLNKWLDDDNIKCSRWSLKKFSPAAFKIFSGKSFVVREQMEIHKALMHAVKKQVNDDSLKSEATISCYIDLYLKYAVYHNYSIYKNYRFSHAARIAVLVLTIMVVAMAVWGRMIRIELSEKNKQERNNRYNKERIEEIEKYNRELYEQILQTAPTGYIKMQN